jgi:hypothetical protein
MLHFRQLMGDRRCCPEGQTLLCSVCRHTLALVFGPSVGKPSDVVSRERQTRPGTLFQRLSLERVGRDAASRVRRVCRLRTGCVCCPGMLQASLDHVYHLGGAFVAQRQTRLSRRARSRAFWTASVGAIDARPCSVGRV